MPLTFSRTLAQSFFSLSLSFPIWNVIIPDLTAWLGSCEFNDIRAHERGTTLKSYKSTEGEKKVRRCLLCIWFPYRLRHLLRESSLGDVRQLSSRFGPQGPQW